MDIKMPDDTKPVIKLTMTFECATIESGLEFAEEAYQNFFYKTYQDPSDKGIVHPKMLNWALSENGIDTFQMDVSTPTGTDG